MIGESSAITPGLDVTSAPLRPHPGAALAQSVALATRAAETANQLVARLISPRHPSPRPDRAAATEPTRAGPVVSRTTVPDSELTVTGPGRAVAGADHAPADSGPTSTTHVTVTGDVQRAAAGSGAIAGPRDAWPLISPDRLASTLWMFGTRPLAISQDPRTRLARWAGDPTRPGSITDRLAPFEIAAALNRPASRHLVVRPWAPTRPGSITDRLAPSEIAAALNRSGPRHLARSPGDPTRPGSISERLAPSEIAAALDRNGATSVPAPPILIASTPGGGARAGDAGRAGASFSVWGRSRPVSFGAGVAPATRFATVMRASRPDPVGSLPQHLRPLAAALAGPGPIGISTGPATRAALAAAGKQAATVGRVIHLRQPLDRSSRTTGIVAHELVHVGRAAGSPRFFDDERASHEEHLATHVGSLARALATTQPAVPGRRSPTGLAWGTAGLAVGGGYTLAAAGSGRASEVAHAAASVVPRTVRRAVQRAVTGGSLGSIATADRPRHDDPADRFAGFDHGGQLPDGGSAPSDDYAGSSGDGSPPLGAGHGSAPAALVPAGSAASALHLLVHPPAFAGGPAAPTPFIQTGASPVNPSPSSVGSSAAPVSEETIEWIIERIEQRIIDELERRGLRHNPGVF